MKELKSKKTGKTSIYTDEEYKEMVRSGFPMNRFEVTDLQSRPIVPSVKAPKELKKDKA